MAPTRAEEEFITSSKEEEEEVFITSGNWRGKRVRGGVYLELYTREARFLTRWDQHAVALRRRRRRRRRSFKYYQR